MEHRIKIQYFWDIPFWNVKIFQRYALAEHMVCTSQIFRIPSWNIEIFQASAAVKHITHILNIWYIPGWQIYIFQFSVMTVWHAVAEHRCHIPYIWSIPGFKTSYCFQVIAVHEHCSHISNTFCIPSCHIKLFQAFASCKQCTHVFYMWKIKPVKPFYLLQFRRKRKHVCRCRTFWYIKVRHVNIFYILQVWKQWICIIAVHTPAVIRTDI